MKILSTILDWIGNMAFDIFMALVVAVMWVVVGVMWVIVMIGKFTHRVLEFILPDNFFWVSVAVLAFFILLVVAGIGTFYFIISYLFFT